MGILRSILSTVARNFVQLAFLAVLTILTVSILISFLSSAETVTNDRDKISLTSNDADFSIDKSKIEFNPENDKDTFTAYLKDKMDKEKEIIVGTFYENDVPSRMILLSDRKIAICTYIDDKEGKRRVYEFKNKKNPKDSITSLAGLSHKTIRDDRTFYDKNNNQYILTTSEAATLAHYLSRELKNARTHFLFELLRQLGLKYLFSFSYFPSQVFSVKFDDKDGIKREAFLRMFPANFKDKTPYNLHIIKGKKPGEELDPFFYKVTQYKGKSKDPYIICDRAGKWTNWCFDNVKKQIVINQNFANTNGIKIGDHITVNAIRTQVVGIGESKLVAFPSIMPLYPIPTAKKNGVFWVYDRDISDGILDVTNIGTKANSYSGGGMFSEDVIYGKFNGVPEARKANFISYIKKELLEKVTSKSAEGFIFSRSDKKFLGKFRVDTLDTISSGFRTLTYTLAAILIAVLILIGLLSTKSLLHDTRDRLTIMKVIGFSRKFIIFVYSLIPAIICSISTICGFFLGLYFNELLLGLIKPMMLNDIPTATVSNGVIAIIILIPLLALMTTTILTTYFLIKEPASQSLKLHDSKKPSKLYIFWKSLFPSFIRKSKIHISFFISSFGKVITLIVLTVISTLVLFISMVVSQTATDYSNNYLSGKNYESAIFYYQPTWNIPTSRYTLATAKDSVYSLVNAKKIERILSKAASSNDITGLFDQFLSATWIKDSFISIADLGKYDTFNYPNISVGGTKFSKEEVKELVCSAALGEIWETMDKSKSTISSCLLSTFTENVPKYLQERVTKNKDYPFSFTRIDFNPKKEELFTWADYEYFAKSDKLSTLENNNVKLGKGRMIGLGENQKKVKLIDEKGKDLFPLMRDYWINTIDNNNNIIPVVINKTVAGKYKIKKGDFLKVDIIRKEFVNNLNGGKPVYAINRNSDGKIIKTSGEFTRGDPSAPDGELYNYYFEDQAKGLEHLTLVEYKGLAGLGWNETDKFRFGVRDKVYEIKKKNDRDALSNSKNYYVIGVTENLELNKNIMYTMQGYVNKSLHFPDSVAAGETHPWFNGKFTNYVKNIQDVFEKQSCITHPYGAFSQNSISTNVYDNPLTPCVFDIEFKDLIIDTIGGLSSTLDIFLFSILFLFAILNIIIAYIINSVAARSMKKIIGIMRALGYKAGRILWTISLTYIPPLLVFIPLTLGILYWLFTEYVHQFLIDNLVDLPIHLRWWYYAASGGAIFLLFIIFFLINFSVILKKVTGVKKK